MSTLNFKKFKSPMEDTSDVSQQPPFSTHTHWQIQTSSQHNITTALTQIQDEISHTHSPFHVALSSHQLASHINLPK
jgi:hypothetical protein